MNPAPAVEAPRIYPDTHQQRNRWIAALRPAVERSITPWEEPVASLREQEPAHGGKGAPAEVFTIFLNNRECPWHCLMCDLWRHTRTEHTPRAAIPAQINKALQELERTDGSHRNRDSQRHIKLYNSGSFFDARAIPTEDHTAIAGLCRGFDKVIVECHPRMVNESCLRFRDLLLRTTDQSRSRTPALEIAIGLETAHPLVLNRLNKGFDLRRFEKAARFLAQHQIGLRVFLLVQPPFLRAADVRRWTSRSVSYCIENQAAVVSLIPTRGGNGAMEALQKQGQFSPPSLEMLETCMDDALGNAGENAVVLADTWDLQVFSKCSACLAARTRRLQLINLSQLWHPPVECPSCSRENRL